MDSSKLKEAVRRRSEVGSGALLPLGGYGATPHTTWILRRRSADIRRIRRSDDSEHELRAGDWGIEVGRSNTMVRVVALAIGIGFRPFDEDDIAVSFINEYGDLDMGLLENLTLQEEIPLFLLGETKAADISGTMRNVHRDWAKRTLAAIKELPPWTERDFDRARAKLQDRFLSKLNFWKYLGRHAF